MLGVGEAPGVVGDEEQRVDDQANVVVHTFGLGESAMTGFMGQFPEAGGDQSLCKCIGCPGKETEARSRKMMDLRCKCHKSEHNEEISSNVCEREKRIAFEAMTWDGVMDLFHGVGWRGEERCLLSIYCCYHSIVGWRCVFHLGRCNCRIFKFVVKQAVMALKANVLYCTHTDWYEYSSVIAE